jgi:predicted ribosome quality control (RQC) complex YloA/Tae2 family protein
MSLDGNIVRHLTKEFNEILITGRINKIYQLSKYDLLLNISTKQGKKQLLISSSPNYSRIHITDMKYEKPNTPPAFCMFLRKHLEGGIINTIYQKENDRVIVFEIMKRNELGDLSIKNLIVEVMGRHSNLIITSNDFKIMESIKHQMPFDGNERTLFPGAIYEFPCTEKLNPYNENERNTFLSNPDNINYQNILSNFMGFSPLITTEIMYRFESSNIPMKTIFSNILSESSPVLISSNRDHFYYTDIQSIKGGRIKFENVNKLVDRYYYDKDTIDIIKQKSKDTVKFIKNYISRLDNKIDKLNTDLRKTKKRDILRIKGELIQANLHLINKGDSKLSCNNYYTNEPEIIELNNKLSPIDNSKKYFKKYKKLKTSIPHIDKQIISAKLELRYFNQLMQQIENASLKDIEEIKDELVDKKYIKRSLKHKKRKIKPNFDTYYDNLGIEILVGKNNLQNSHITHTVARHNEIWFHVKGAPGSHVVTRKVFPLEEETIRTAAQLAAYFSKMKTSSSVPVDYLEIRYIKKIPGKINSFVTYKNNKTIYIDPDESFILNLRKK